MNFGSVRYGRMQERILRVATFGVAMGARGEGTWTGTRQTVGGQVDLYLLTDKKSNPSVCCYVPQCLDQLLLLHDQRPRGTLLQQRPLLLRLVLSTLLLVDLRAQTGDLLLPQRQAAAQLRNHSIAIDSNPIDRFDQILHAGPFGGLHLQQALQQRDKVTIQIGWKYAAPYLFDRFRPLHVGGERYEQFEQNDTKRVDVRLWVALPGKLFGCGVERCTEANANVGALQGAS
uniref:Uncharacterized protein n=1 Tax=Anopheles merus TaxID=30066 RepID=A0A182UPS4_ANOME